VRDRCGRYVLRGCELAAAPRRRRRRQPDETACSPTLSLSWALAQGADALTHGRPDRFRRARPSPAWGDGLAAMSLDHRRRGGVCCALAASSAADRRRSWRPHGGQDRV